MLWGSLPSAELTIDGSIDPEFAEYFGEFNEWFARTRIALDEANAEESKGASKVSLIDAPEVEDILP